MLIKNSFVLVKKVLIQIKLRKVGAKMEITGFNKLILPFPLSPNPKIWEWDHEKEGAECKVRKLP